MPERLAVLLMVEFVEVHADTGYDTGAAAGYLHLTDSSVRHGAEADNVGEVLAVVAAVRAEPRQANLSR